MKKGYVKPQAAFETFEINTSIASGCDNKVSFGPGDEALGYKMCDEFKDSWEISAYAFGDTPAYANFYEEGGCECYLTAGDTLMFTS